MDVTHPLGYSNFAFTRHETTLRRVVMYRGVYPVAFDITGMDVENGFQSVFHLLIRMGHVKVGDLVIVSKGELSGVAGKTNALQILRVTERDHRPGNS